MKEEEQQKLTVMMVELSAKVQTILDKQEELAENVSQIKEAVYNPDQGLYARLKELDTRIQLVESWKNINVQLMWVGGTCVLGLLAQTAWRAIF
jgi:hypothetical protein